MRKLLNFIKRNIFAILSFIFIWLMPLIFIGTKIKYIQINIAWKITIYGFIALFILYVALKKQITDLLFKKTGYKGLRDYAIKQKYSLKRGLLLVVVMWFKLGIATAIIYMLSQLMQNAYDNWLLILGLIGIGSMFLIINNIVKKEKVEEIEDEIE